MLDSNWIQARLVTVGDDVNIVTRFPRDGAENYSAADVVAARMKGAAS